MTVAVSVLMIALGVELLFGGPASIAGISATAIGIPLLLAGFSTLIYAFVGRRRRTRPTA